MKTSLIIQFSSVLIILAISLYGCYNDNEEELYLKIPTTDTTKVMFSKDVLPIFQSNCALSGCHIDPNPAKGIRLNSYQGIIDGQILTIRASIHNEGSMFMPPSPNSPLSPKQLSIIDDWINLGMPDN